MALLGTDQCVELFQDGRCGRTALYALKNVDASDTVDVASSFKVVKRAGIVSDTGTTIAAISTITGTVLTIPAGPAGDAVWLLVCGVAS
jgi:uncharacterized membrane protein